MDVTTRVAAPGSRSCWPSATSANRPLTGLVGPFRLSLGAGIAEPGARDGKSGKLARGEVQLGSTEGVVGIETGESTESDFVHKYSILIGYALLYAERAGLSTGKIGVAEMTAKRIFLRLRIFMPGATLAATR
jgi:hypothetical protein